MARSDTSPTALRRQRAVFAAMSPTQRLEAAAQMSEDVRALAASGIRARQPGLSEAEVQAALVRLLVGRELEIESAERDPDAR